MKQLPEHYIEEVCPNCSEIVEFTRDDLSQYDGEHLEIYCPHCGIFCCFICGHIYGFSRKQENNK